MGADRAGARTARAAPVADHLRIGGMSRLSSCDWPGRLVATVFCQGCPWSCRYCHNPELIPVTGAAPVRWSEVAALLAGRRGLLDAVVFSGGEPTLQPALAAAAAAVRDLGFAVGLHTSGAYPQRLAEILHLVDWVGLDIKAPPRLYRMVTGSASAADRALASLRLLVSSGIDYEIRTTVDPTLLDEQALTEVADLLAAEGVTSFAVQQARFGTQPTRPAASTGGAAGPSERVLDRCREKFATFVHRTG